MADTRNKRKFDDSGPNISYNRVPPPPSDFERARQKALEIAARINAEGPDLSKEEINRQDERKSSQSPLLEARSRHKFDDSGPNTLDVELAKQRAQQILARFAVQDTKRTYPEEEPHQDDKPSAVQNSGQFLQIKKPEFSTGSFYGGHGPPESRKVEIPNAKVGLVIGKGGDTIKQIQLQSGARVQITKDMDHNPNAPFRTVELMGTLEQIERAEQAIHDVIAEAEAAAAAASNSSHSTYAPVGEQMQLTVPTNKVGLIIGRGGETIKGLQSKTGARIQLVPLMGPSEYQSGVAERVLSLMGSKEQVDAASELIKELINENRVRPTMVQGGYQGYPPPPPPPQWGPAMQQQGYGYQQGSYYPGPPPTYGSYPPPPAAAWSQPAPVPSQQYQPPGSYGYYTSQAQVEYPQAVGYEQQGPYAEHPPGASQDVYGHQIRGQSEPYGQMGAYATYGSTDPSSFGPPGVTAITNSQGASQEGFGPPGVGELTYGKQTSEQGPPGVGQEGLEVQNSSHQGYATDEKQSSMYSFDGANATSYGQHDPLTSQYGAPGPAHADGQEIAGQVNYGQSGTGYWSNHYGYAGYETYQQSGYEQQIPEHSGHGQPSYEQLQGKHSEVLYEEKTLASVPPAAYGSAFPSSGHGQEPAPACQGEEEGSMHGDSKLQEFRHENGFTVDTPHASDKKDGTGGSDPKDVVPGDHELRS